MTRFQLSPRTTVLSTRFVMKEGSPILCVAHFEDGLWQFFGPEEEVADEDILVVALEEVLAVGSAIHELAQLPQGF